MLKKFHQLLNDTAANRLFVLGLLLIGVTGLLDYTTGFEISFAVFYVGPIAISWYCGRRLGIILSLLATISWLIGDTAAGHQYSQSWIPIWNALTRFALFFFTVYVLTSIRQRIKQEELLARTDALTGLSNSRHFREQLELLFRMANRQAQPLALAYIDLDNFKQVNDSFGHATGDLVLKQVGQVLSESVRGSDLAGRLGGDEFAVLLTGTSSAGAETYFNRLQQRLLAEMQAHNWPVGFSIGVAIYSEPDPADLKALHVADELMYQAKRQGKNRVFCQEINPQR